MWHKSVYSQFEAEQIRAFDEEFDCVDEPSNPARLDVLLLLALSSECA